NPWADVVDLARDAATPRADVVIPTQASLALLSPAPTPTARFEGRRLVPDRALAVQETLMQRAPGSCRRLAADDARPTKRAHDARRAIIDAAAPIQASRRTWKRTG